MLNVLIISAFDVNFAGSDGEKLKDEIEISMAEFAAVRPFNPLYKYMRWGPTIQRAKKAANYIKDICRNFLLEYRSNHTPEEIKKDTSILGHLVRCPYENDDKRCADMQSFLFAGLDTSSITIAWTLIEVLKHPHVLIGCDKNLISFIPIETSLLMLQNC